MSANTPKSEKANSQWLGRQFGDLKVIEYNQAKVLCKCSCGNEKEYLTSNLRKGKTLSCGCKLGDLIRKRNSNHLKLVNSERELASKEKHIGVKYHSLTVTDVIKGKFICLCKCGNIKTSGREAVLSGKTTSCGCERGERLRKNRKDWVRNWIGNRYGKLEVVSDLPGYNAIVKCDCGTSKEVFKGNLVNGDIKSCGCASDEMRMSTNLEKYGSETVAVTISKGEIEVRDWVESLGLSSSRKSLKRKTGRPFEIDILVESKNIGIEFNGARWHSDDNRAPGYHKEKSDLAKDQGIRIIHIYDFEWKRNPTSIKSYLRSALGMNSIKVAARKTVVREITTSEAKEFLDTYHILGFVAGKYIGCFLKEELLAVAVLRKHHVTNNELVLARWCVKENVTVQGGLSKVMSKVREILNPPESKVISWADIRLSNADGYLSSGWEIEAMLGPDYFYYDPNNKKVIYKYLRRKSVAGTPPEMTEKEHAKADGLYRIWDCGKIRLSYKIS